MIMPRAVSILCFLGTLPLLAPECEPLPAPDLPAPASPMKSTDTAGRSHIAGLMPRGITSFGAVADEGWVYVLGGYFGTPHEYAQEDQSASFFRMNALDRWAVQELPGVGPIQSVGLAVYEGKIVRAGGLRVKNKRGQPQDLESVDECAIFDPSTGKWTPLPPLPSPRSSHGVAVLDGRLYVAGGWWLEKGKAIWHDFMSILDLRREEPRWLSVPQPFKSRALGVAAAGGKVYALGGMADRAFTRRVDVFDPSNLRWSPGPDLPADAFGVALTASGKRLFAQFQDGSIHSLEGTAAAWKPEGTLAFPRFFGAGVELGPDHLAFVGGMGSHDRHRAIETFSPGCRSADAERTGTTWTLPHKGEAKNRQAILVHDDRLLLIGGNRKLGQHDFEPDDFSREALSLDLGSMEARSFEPFPVARQSMETVVDPGGESAYVVGGFGHDGKAARTHADIHRLDLKKLTWHRLESRLPEGRTQFALAEHEGNYWMLGGLDYDPGRGEEAFRYPMEVLRWRPASAQDDKAPVEDSGVRIPRARRTFGNAVVGGKLYMVGGMGSEFELVEPCDVLDLTKGTWSTIPSPSRPRLSPELVAAGPYLYLTGGLSPRRSGSRELEPDPTLERFDTRRGVWETLTKIPLIPPHVRMVEGLRGRLLTFSTHFGGIPRLKVNLLDPCSFE